MLNTVEDRLIYDVAVDYATLSLVNLEKGGTRCSVLLSGSIDRRWVEAFARERRESHSVSRYELNPSTRTVSFVRDPGSDPADVMEALETLAAMVERVSRRASQSKA